MQLRERKVNFGQSVTFFTKCNDKNGGIARERENLLQVHLDYTALLGGTG